MIYRSKYPLVELLFVTPITITVTFGITRHSCVQGTELTTQEKRNDNSGLEALSAAKKRIIEIREKSSEPEVILKRLKSLAQEFRKKLEDSERDRKKTGVYRDGRAEGLEMGYMMAEGSIKWFLNEP
jgi:hypothetical protein